MNWIRQKLKEIFLIFLSTALLIIVLELFMFIVNARSEYFPTEKSTWTFEFDGVGSISSYCESALTEAKQLNVAIFGGSSTAGYASPVSFSKILCDYNSKNINLKITNFGRNGEAFSDFQAELIKKVMKNYDVLVLYAGHNEFLTQAYRRSNRVVFPNGDTLNDPKIVHSAYARIVSAVDDKSFDMILFLQNFIIENSRIYYFLIKTINAMEEVNVLNSQPYPSNFFYKNNFLTEFERKNILELFKKNLEEIANKLGSEQKLIISTVMSNDLFPPIADVYKDIDRKTDLDELNKKLNNLYLQMSDNNLDRIKEDISALPVSANKHYLEGLLCLELKGKLLTKSDKNECFNKLKEARRNDAAPYRVVPEINSYIRSINQKNVIVADPVKDMMDGIDNLNQYKDFFVDFAHPSQLGHAIIGKNILSAIYPDEILPDSFNSELCGISWEKNGKIEYSLRGDFYCVDSLETNIRWLNGEIEGNPAPFLYDYYKSNSERNLDKFLEDLDIFKELYFEDYLKPRCSLRSLDWSDRSVEIHRCN
jgi:hypothetical protein